MQFVLSFAKNSTYTVTSSAESHPPERQYIDPNVQKSSILVSIGSGVSIIKVNAFDSFERVSGTMIGGGTLIGLSNLLTGLNDFDEIIAAASKGDHSKVDMMVRDIYGDNSPFHDLQSDLLASSFAKVANDQGGSGVSDRFSKEDVLASLVCMISFNIGQLAYYQAQQHDCDTIYFVGNFVRNNLLGMSHIRMIVDLMQQTQNIKSRFLTYDGYLGALGAFMNEFEK